MKIRLYHSPDAWRVLRGRAQVISVCACLAMPVHAQVAAASSAAPQLSVPLGALTLAAAEAIHGRDAGATAEGESAGSATGRGEKTPRPPAGAAGGAATVGAATAGTAAVGGDAFDASV